MKRNLTPKQKRLVLSHLATAIRREEYKLLVGLDVNAEEDVDRVNLFLWKVAERIEKMNV